MSLEEFLAARLDERDREARDLGKMFAVDTSEVLREGEAMRAILSMWEDAARHRYNLPEGVAEGRDDDERMRDDAVAESMDEVVAHLAAIWSGHPDYDQEWKP